MNTVNKNLSADAALAVARQYAGLKPEEIETVTMVRRSGLYEIELRSAFMKYEIYVDAADGQVPGFLCEPLPLEWMDSDELRFSMAG